MSYKSSNQIRNNQEQNFARIGKKNIIKESFEVAERYRISARDDEKAAETLWQAGLYNQAGYFFIQAMEKQITTTIASRINMANAYFADEISKTIGHSLDESIALLLKIFVPANPALKEMLGKQLLEGVLRNVHFKMMHNSVRYPLYNKKFGNYTELILSSDDCQMLKDMLEKLKKYLADLSMIK